MKKLIAILLGCVSFQSAQADCPAPAPLDPFSYQVKYRILTNYYSTGLYQDAWLATICPPVGWIPSCCPTDYPFYCTFYITDANSQSFNFYSAGCVASLGTSDGDPAPPWFATPTPTPTPTPYPTPTPTPTPELLSASNLNSSLVLPFDPANASTTDGATVTSNGSPASSKNCPIQKACADPVNISTGMFWHEQVDIQLRGRTPDTNLVLKRSYVARPFLRAGDFGPNWFPNYETRLLSVSNTTASDLVWIDETGGAWTFVRQTNGSFQNPPGFFGRLFEYDDRYEMYKKGGLTYVFSRNTSVAPGGRLIQIKERHGETVDLVYTSGKLTSVSTGLAGSLQFNRDSNGLVTSVLRVRDNLTYTYVYNSNHELVSVTDFSNRVNSYVYQSIGTLPERFLSSFTDHLNRTTSMTYDSIGRVTQQLEKGMATRLFSYLYDSSLGLNYTEVREANGGIWKYYRDSVYRTIKQVNPYSYEQNQTWTSTSQIATSTDEWSKVTTYGYDARGNLSSIKKPLDPYPTTFSYNQTYDVLTLEVPIVDAPTIYSLNLSNGDITHVTRYDSSLGTSTLSKTYDNLGNVLATTNQYATYTDQYNANGLKTYVYDLHNPETRTYDTRGRLSQSSFASGRVLNYTYNDDDWVTQVTDNSGPTTSYTYDAIGRVLTKTVSSGFTDQITTYTWDNLDRLLSVSDPTNHTTYYFYDKYDTNSNLLVFKNPVSITDARNKTTSFEYDLLDRTVKKRDSNNHDIWYTWDERGDLNYVLDANGRYYGFFYDDNRRLVWKYDFSLKSDYVYNSPHNPSWTGYTYDAQGRVLKENRMSATGSYEFSGTEYTYNRFGKMATKDVYSQIYGQPKNYQDQSYYEYDNQLDVNSLAWAQNDQQGVYFTKEKAPPFKTSYYSVESNEVSDDFFFTRDNTGEISMIKNRNGETVLTASHDAAGRLTNIASGNMAAFGTNSLSVTVAYDGFGRKSEVQYSTGLTGDYSYDLNDRMTDIEWKTSIFNTVMSEALIYDEVGNVTKRTRESGEVEDFLYDGTSQLTEVKVTNGSTINTTPISYDASGNRLTYGVGYSVYTNNFMTSSPLASFLADPDGYGSVRQQDHASTGAHSLPEHRFDGRSWSFYHADSSWNSVVSTNYEWDVFGRRTFKDVWTPSSDFTETSVYLGEDDKIFLTKNGFGQYTLYLDGQGIDEHFGHINSSGAVAYVTDHLGSVLNTSVAGPSMKFGVFGETSATRYTYNVNNPDPLMYGFAGRTFDQESGYYHMRARMYDPDSGRFISKDPIGLNGGDINLYRYVGNNPLRYTDPLGLIINDQTKGGIPQEVKDTPLYKRLNADKKNTITIVQNAALGTYFGLTTQTGTSTQLVQLNPVLNFDRAETIDSIIHELGHAEANIYSDFSTSAEFDHKFVVPEALLENVLSCP